MAKSRPRPIPSMEVLKDMALRYVLRFPCTVEKMRSHLSKKVEQAQKEAVAPPEAEAWIQEVIEILLRVRILDDRQYAEGRALTLHQRGRSNWLILSDLKKKGVSEALGKEVIAALLDDGRGEWEAGMNLARKKKLGPYGESLDGLPYELRQKEMQKQLSKLARAGFSYEMARKILDFEFPEDEV